MSAFLFWEVLIVRRNKKSDEKVIAAYKKQNEKAVNAIKKLYK